MIEKIILKYAAKNRADYGKAEEKAVVGKILAEKPGLKKNIKELLEKVGKIVEKINKMNRGEIEKIIEKEQYVKKEENERTFQLKGAEEGKVVTRFLPEPNGWLHIGHAKALFLSLEVAKQYKGRCLLRFDDTNPDKERAEFVDAIKEDLKWLGAKFDGESYTSDLMPALYKYAEQLIAQKDAYICTCAREEISKNRTEGKGCKCRERTIEENQKLWKEMKNGVIEKGGAVLRLKGDMKSLNMIMRDPVLFRINTTCHYRQGEKYRLWPTYDFEVSISDSLSGVTHALRSKEYELRDELYYEILKRLKLRRVEVYDFARLNIKGTLLSKRFLRPLIEEGKVEGWDDPRLPTLKGLKRRGVQPEAIREFVLSFGLGKAESSPDWEKLLVFNRKILNGKSKHYFLVREPVKLTVENAAERIIELKVKLEKAEQKRLLGVGRNFYIDFEDAEKLKKGEELNLKDLYPIKIKKIGKEISAEKLNGNKIYEKKIQWVPVKDSINCKLKVVEDLIKENGEFNEESLKIFNCKCEGNAKKIEKREIVQFERIGFCILDNKDKMEFIKSC